MVALDFGREVAKRDKRVLDIRREVVCVASVNQTRMRRFEDTESLGFTENALDSVLRRTFQSNADDFHKHVDVFDPLTRTMHQRVPFTHQRDCLSNKHITKSFRTRHTHTKMFCHFCRAIMLSVPIGRPGSNRMQTTGCRCQHAICDRCANRYRRSWREQCRSCRQLVCDDCEVRCRGNHVFCRNCANAHCRFCTKGICRGCNECSIECRTARFQKWWRVRSLRMDAKHLLALVDRNRRKCRDSPLARLPRTVLARIWFMVLRTWTLPEIPRS